MPLQAKGGNPMSEILHDLPSEVFQEYFTNTGFCDAQTVTPRDADYRVQGEYLCHCTCGRWDVVAPDRLTGLAMAREHTREITEALLAKIAETEKADKARASS
jgi:hypothetical protein